MSGKELALCNGIIHFASLAATAAGGGLAQIPGSDNLVISPIQLTMVVALGRVFGITLEESNAKAMVGNATAASVGKTASKVFVGKIPGYGNVVNAVTAATVTEAIGWVIANEFEKQRDSMYKVGI